jgi:hypothetical protein
VLDEQRVVEVPRGHVDMEAATHDRPLSLHLVDGDVDTRVVEPGEGPFHSVVAHERLEIAAFDADMLEQPQVRAPGTVEDGSFDDRDQLLGACPDRVLDLPPRCVDVERRAQEAAEAGDVSPERRNVVEDLRHAARVYGVDRLPICRAVQDPPSA